MMLSSPRYIYFAINHRESIIKIGISHDPAGRVQTLPYTPEGRFAGKLRGLGCFAGEYRDERAAHQKFSRFELRPEWFFASHEILQSIFSDPRIMPFPTREKIFADDRAVFNAWEARLPKRKSLREQAA